MIGRIGGRGLVAVPLVATTAVYWPVVRCFFHDDDFVHLYQAVNSTWWNLLVPQWGGHMITTFSATVVAMLQVFGPSARAFYGSMLVGHLVAVGILFAVLRRLTGDRRVAAIIAVLWGTSPLHAVTLGWFSVFAQVIATVTMLLAIAVTLILSDASGDRAPAGLVAVLPLLLLAGALAFGVGIAFAFAFPMVAWLLLPAGRPRQATIALATLVGLAVPLLYHLTLADPGLPGMARALGRPHLLGTVVLPGLVRLLANGVTRLHLAATAAVPALPASLLAIVALVWTLGIGVALARAPATVRRQMIACAVLVFALYGSVALGRPFLPAGADVGTVARYHYAATVPLAMLSGLALHALASGRHVPARMLDALLVGLLLGMLVGPATTRRPIDDQAAAREEAARVLATVEAAAAGAPPGAVVRVPNRPFAGIWADPRGFPGWAAIFVVWSPSNDVGGHRVVFVERDPAVVAAAAMGRRSADLLVPATDPAE